MNDDVMATIDEIANSLQLIHPLAMSGAHGHCRDSRWEHMILR
jgi:hypothetical protein